MRRACTPFLRRRRRHAAPVSAPPRALLPLVLLALRVLLRQLLRRLPPNTAPGAARAGEPADSSASHEVAVREQEPVALLEETRQTFTIIREKFSLRSRKQ